MYSRIKSILVLILITLSIFSCGKQGNDNILLTGNVELGTENRDFLLSSPLFVVVSKTMDYNRIIRDPLDSIIEIAMVDSLTNNFNIDLSATGLKTGDKIYLFAFTDIGYEGGIPTLSAGNILGFYINEDNFELGYTLHRGNNNYIQITVDRIVYDFEATITGNITTEEAGEVTLVAYTGNINSFNFDDIDINRIIGYTQVSCTTGSNTYTLDILPYGFNVPISDVYVFAFLDKNENGKPDAGDLWGSDFDDDGYPFSLTINGDSTSTFDINLNHILTQSSGYTFTLQGNIEAPAGYGPSSPPVFMIVCKADNPDAIISDTVNSIKYFEKLPAGATTFNLVLSDTDLATGDRVMIIALWDHDYTTGFPRLSNGDIIGYYTNTDSSYEYPLKNGINSGITVSLNKTYCENNASVQGTIECPESGDVIIVGYSGEIDSYNIQFDSDKIIGYEKFIKTAGSLAYSMKIFPFITFPVNDVYIFAFLDRNSNGKPDAGDKWGCYSDDGGYPMTVIVRNEALIGNNFELSNEIAESTSSNISLQGSFTAPAGYGAGSPPVFMIVCETDDPEKIYSNTMDTIRYFEKLPAGATSFNLDLSSSGLAPGDKVMVIAMWDRDYVSGFPRLTPGDMIGYYVDNKNYSYNYPLADGVNSGININLNKTYSKNTAKVSGKIIGTETGDVMIIAYTGEFNSLDATIDVDKIIGYKEITKGAADLEYSMDLLPFSSTFPVKDVFIFAVLDVNKNGTPDNGDRLGFYTNNDNKIPSLVTLQDSDNKDLDIELTMDYTKPVSGGTEITLSGSIQAPDGYTSDASTNPIFIIIAKADNTFDLFNNPMSAIKYFKRLPQGTKDYNLDLTGTGLVPGDEIRILAVWDKNFAGGFPNPGAGDKIGYYQQKSEFIFSKKLAAGTNNAPTGNGWSFGVDKTLYDHNAQLSFQFGNNELPDDVIIGNDVLVIMVYRDGVDDGGLSPSYGITNMDYIISLDYINNIQDLDISYTVDLFPFIYDGIPLNSNPLRMNNIYIYVILDSKKNGMPDTGEYVGYYYTDTLTFGQKKPKIFSTLYYDGRINTLPEDEFVSFVNRKY